MLVHTNINYRFTTPNLKKKIIIIFFYLKKSSSLSFSLSLSLSFSLSLSLSLSLSFSLSVPITSDKCHAWAMGLAELRRTLNLNLGIPIDMHHFLTIHLKGYRKNNSIFTSQNFPFLNRGSKFSIHLIGAISKRLKKVFLYSKICKSQSHSSLQYMINNNTHTYFGFNIF